MYILLIFHNLECTTLNSFIKFNTIKDIISWSNGLIKYSDSKKKVRCYKTQKSFFRILNINNDDEVLYFQYKYVDLRKTCH